MSEMITTSNNYLLEFKATTGFKEMQVNPERPSDLSSLVGFFNSRNTLVDQSISAYIMPDYKVIELAAVAMAADAEFLSLLAATPDAIGADDAEIAAILNAHHEACIALAAVSAVTLAGWQAKALALAPVVLRTRAHPATLDDDTGLAASLIVDLIRAV